MARREIFFKRPRRILPLACIAMVVGLCSLPTGALGQQSPTAHSPVRYEPALFILGDQIVEQQWKSAPNLINMPAYWRQVEPGQCVRFGVELSKADLDKFHDAKLEVDFSAGGHDQKFPPEPTDTIKQLKADNGDIMRSILSKAGMNGSQPALLSVAVSHSKWCAPADVADGTATIQAQIVAADGKATALKPASLTIKTFATSAAAPVFADTKTLGSWVQRYYAAPDPGQLLPAMRLAASDPMLQRRADFLQFLVSAYKASPLAANDAIRRLPQESHATRVYAFPVFGLTGIVSPGPIPDDFTPAEKSRAIRTYLPDAQNMTPDPTIGARMDMLWNIFFATGDIAPVKKISGLLAWRADHDTLVEMKKSRQMPKQPTPEIMRGVGYMTAGWSLSALSRSNGLVADYLDAIKAAPETDPEVKTQLAGLYFNKDFQVRQAR